MAFTPRPLQIPNMRTDYSAENSAFSGLGQTLGNLPGEFRKEQLAQQKQQILGQIGSGALDYDKGGRALIALGDTQAGATLLGLGQKQLENEAYKSSPLTLGGASQPAAPSQSVVPLGAAVVARPRGVQVAETEADVQRLEAEASGRSQAGDPTQPRGLRNNNPGNIEAGRFAATVQGFQGSDGRFARYETPEQGIQAADKLLQSYAGRGLNTVNGIVNRWAPPSENNTGSYVASVAKELGVSPDQPLDMSNPEVRQRLIAAKIRVENGRQPYGEEVFQRSYAGSGAPVQVAEAAPQPNAPMSDAPAPGANFVTGPATTQAAQAQGFAIPGTSLPPNDPAPKVSTQELIQVLANPRLATQHALAKQILDNRQKYSDENAPDKREMTRLQTEKLRREVEGEGATPLSADERKSFGIPEGQAAYKTRSGEIKFGPAGTKVDINQKGESKFEEALGTAQAKRWNGYIEEGDVAQTRLADIQTLRDTSRRLGSQGSSANLKSTIGPLAESLKIPIEGLSDIQLYESITNRLAPTLRAPGSGSTSDIEFKGFQRAIGPLSNTPAAREMILDTFEAASRNDVARSQIASRLASGEINRGEAEKQLRALPDPMTSFKEFRKQNPDLVGQALKESAKTDYEQRNAPVKVDSADTYSKLKPGDKYTDPEGNIRTKR